MKTHVLATAVLAALAWRAAVAASEGGDTWSAVERVQQSAYSVLQPAQQVEPATAMNASRDCSEGGDTWSNLQALHETTFGQAGTQDRTGPTEAMVAGPDGGSEGGDTWSRFLPQPEGRSTNTAEMASNPRL